MNKLSLVSIILPTYNEAGNIVELIKEIDKQVKSKKEILVIDDDSPDGTSHLVQEFIKTSDIPVRLITRKKDHGLTNSINEGIKQMKGEAAVWLDCDFSMPPKHIQQLIDKLEEGFDIAKGSRYMPGGGVKHSKDSADPYLGIVLSKLLNKGARRLLGSNITDYTAGFIAAKKTVLEKISLRGDYGEYAPDFIIRAGRSGFTFAEIPFVALPRTKGESKTGQNPWQYVKRGKKYLITIGRLVIKK